MQTDINHITEESLSSAMRHELNNLLTAILGNTELALLEANPSSPIYRYLDQIHGSAAHAARLVGARDYRDQPYLQRNGSSNRNGQGENAKHDPDRR